jgi:hypothetical protein
MVGMSANLGPQLLTGVFLTRIHEKRRLNAEDNRRWLVDRRKIYATYLVLVESMLREIDGVGVFLSYDGTQPLSDEGQELIKDGLFECFN